MRRWAYASFVILALWFVGFVIFVYHIYHFKYPTTPPAAIVVLTGGQERIKAGLSLLDKNPTSLFLISGVHTDRYLREVARYTQYQKNVDIGFKATTTAENAQEIKSWLANRKISHIHVVTSHYHMQRSLLELQQAMPHLKLLPCAVISHQFRNLRWVSRPQNWHLLLKEYTKYIMIYAYFTIKKGYDAGRRLI